MANAYVTYLLLYILYFIIIYHELTSLITSTLRRDRHSALPTTPLSFHRNVWHLDKLRVTTSVTKLREIVKEEENGKG